MCCHRILIFSSSALALETLYTALVLLVESLCVKTSRTMGFVLANMR